MVVSSIWDITQRNGKTVASNSTIPKVDERDLLGIPTVMQKPTVATPQQPVVSVWDSNELPQFTPWKFANIDTMQSNDLEDLVDFYDIQGRSRKLTGDEELQLRKASRTLSKQQLQQPTNVFDEEINRIESERIRTEKTLQEQQETNISNETDRLNTQKEERFAEFEEQGQDLQDASQRSLSFSWFGRSTFAAEQQGKIQKQVNNAKRTLQAEIDAELAKYTAQQRGASEEQLSKYDDYLATLKMQRVQQQNEIVQQMNEFNVQNTANVQERIENILQLSSQFVDPNIDLTQDDLDAANAFAQLAIDAEGNVKESLLKLVDPRIMWEVLKRAAGIKMGIEPWNEFGFSNLWDGQIAVTDPKTWEVTFKQGNQSVSALDRAKIWEIQSSVDLNRAKAEEIRNKVTGGGEWLSGIGTWQVTAYWTEANPFWLDVDGRIWDPIVNKVEGKVVEVGNDADGFGNYVILEDSAGNKVRYAHLDQVTAQKWDLIGVGSQIWTIWNTGYTIPMNGGDGSHVDITLFDSSGKEKTAVDVEKYLNSVAKEIDPKTQVIIEDAKELLNASGFGRLLASAWGIPLTKSRDMSRKLKGIKSVLALDNLVKLKADGATFGALSDNELKFISDSATKLNLGMTKDEWKEEIGNIIRALGGELPTDQDADAALDGLL